jgi:hypothetical protein
MPESAAYAAEASGRTRTATMESRGWLWILSSKKIGCMVVSSIVSHTALPAAGLLSLRDHLPKKKF